MDYINQTGPNGTGDNIGGTATICYWAPSSWFTTIQDTEENLSSVTAFAKLSQINTAHVFASGKGFVKVYNTLSSGSIKDTGTGERDGRSMKSEFTGFYPGSVAEWFGFLRMVKNDKGIFLVPQSDGTVRQIGTSLFPAEFIMESFDTATQESGRRGTTYKVTSYSSGPQIYTPAIALHP